MIKILDTLQRIILEIAKPFYQNWQGVEQAYIARPVKVRRKGEHIWSVYNQSSYVAFDETSSYWSAPESS